MKYSRLADDSARLGAIDASVSASDAALASSAERWLHVGRCSRLPGLRRLLLHVVGRLPLLLDPTTFRLR
jgi:hypothetical protein